MTRATLAHAVLMHIEVERISLRLFWLLVGWMQKERN